MDFSKNRFFFAVGTKLIVKEGYARNGLAYEVEYTVSKESFLPEPHDLANDLDVMVTDPRGVPQQAPAHFFRRKIQ